MFEYSEYQKRELEEQTCLECGEAFPDCTCWDTYKKDEEDGE